MTVWTTLATIAACTPAGEAIGPAGDFALHRSTPTRTPTQAGETPGSAAIPDPFTPSSGAVHFVPPPASGPSSASSAAGPALPKTTPSPPNPELDSFITSKMQEAKIPGLAAAIVMGDSVRWSQGYGFANVAAKTPVTVDTLFELASISKTVTAAAVMQLVEAGTLDLDGDVADALGFAVRNPNFPDTPLTMRMLLTHTSSIVENDALDLQVMGQISPVSLSDYIHGIVVPGGKYYDATKNFDPNAPGTKHIYSNPAVAAAGFVVETKAAVPFDDRVKATIFAPLGMTESSFRLPGLDPSHIATPYDSDGTTEVGNPDYPDFPAGELRTSVAQFTRFLLAMMNGGAVGSARILSSATVDEMFRVQDASVDPDQGLIWYFEPHAGRSILGHNGADVGSSTIMGFDPQTMTGAIVFTNSNVYMSDDVAREATFESIFEHLLEAADGL
jgi:CubicO group peptidase (beta-lactamase class C family)